MRLKQNPSQLPRFGWSEPKGGCSGPAPGGRACAQWEGGAAPPHLDCSSSQLARGTVRERPSDRERVSEVGQGLCGGKAGLPQKKVLGEAC